MEIRVASSISLNGLPPQALVDPEVDLGSEPASLGPADWIVPFDAPPAAAR